MIKLLALLLAPVVALSQVGIQPRNPVPATPATVTNITTTAPVVVTPSGTVFNIALQPCAVGQVLQWATTPLPAGYKCNTPANNDFFRSASYTGALPDGAADTTKNIFHDGDLNIRSMLRFRDVNDSRNTADGITWYPPAPADYGIFRTAGTWTGNPYQQMRLAFRTGIELDPSNTNSTGPSYTKSYVNIISGGLRVERGNTGLGTLSPSTKLHVETGAANDSGLLLQRLNQTSSPASSANSVAIGVDATGKVHVTNAVGSVDTRATNASPQQYNRPAIAHEFKQCASIGLTATQSAATYCGLITFRPYGFDADFSGGQVLQQAYSMDGGLIGRRFERTSAGAATWGAWRITESGARTPSYASVAAAVADAALPVGSVYMVVVGTDKTLKIK